MAKEEVKYQKSFLKMTSITENKSQENNNVSPHRLQNLNLDSVMVCEVQKNVLDTLSEVVVGPSRPTSSPILQLEDTFETSDWKTDWLQEECCHKFMLAFIVVLMIVLLFVAAISPSWASNGLKKFPDVENPGNFLKLFLNL